jgi:cytochrome c oxidase subunit IV
MVMTEFSGEILRPEDTGTVHDEPGGGLVLTHALPLKLLAGVFAALLFLTVVTVAVTRFELGPYNVWIALLIAGVKGALVAEVFMHLHWDRPFHRFLLLAAIAFVVLFIGIAQMDSHSYGPDLIDGYAPAITQ